MSRWIVDFITPHLDQVNHLLGHDQELQEAFSSAAEGVQTLEFALVATSDAPFLEHAVIIRLQGSTNAIDVSIRPGTFKQGVFSLKAKQEHWEKFFDFASLVRPYQSFWGMLRVLGSGEVSVGGDQLSFARYARVWRISLDRIRLAIAKKTHIDSIPEDEEGEDLITGKYIWINHQEYGKVKLFYEYSGTGPQNLLFLHTAGSDSRQYHSLMNDKILQKRCTMFAFDLPGHGRSSLGSQQSMDTYALTETSYVESISKLIEKLKVQDSIVCGASMAGHVCIALAIRARELGIRGAIPCEGCAHLPQPAAIYNMKGNESSILDPERVCGMIAPTSPEYYKKQIWWQYSTQASGVFMGDLKFYFKGWDGRDRLKDIDTAYCPVYMLTGEYDYSCTTEVSKETADTISGAVFEAMPGLGHFPLTENPTKVLPYIYRALDHIQKHRRQ